MVVMICEQSSGTLVVMCGELVVMLGELVALSVAISGNFVVTLWEVVLNQWCCCGKT